MDDTTQERRAIHFAAFLLGIPSQMVLREYAAAMTRRVAGRCEPGDAALIGALDGIMASYDEHVENPLQGKVKQ